MNGPKFPPTTVTYDFEDQAKLYTRQAVRALVHREPLDEALEKALDIEPRPGPDSDQVHEALRHLAHAAAFVLYEALTPVAADEIIINDDGRTVPLPKALKVAEEHELGLDDEVVETLRTTHTAKAGPLKHRGATLDVHADGRLAFRALDAVLRLAEDHTPLDLHAHLELHGLWDPLLDQRLFWETHGDRLREQLHSCPCPDCGLDALEQETWRCLHCGGRGPAAFCEDCGMPGHLVEDGLIHRHVDALELSSRPEHVTHLAFCPDHDPLA